MTETAQFGAKRVSLAAKQALVNDVFHSVARRYDLMNDLMSFGLHRAWKDALVTAVNPPRAAPFSVLDIAGGTGDIAFRLVAAGGAQTNVTICDINPDMLAVGRERAAMSGGSSKSNLILPVTCVVVGSAPSERKRSASPGPCAATSAVRPRVSRMSAPRRW